ncbi:hypothetical protein A5740_22570 [Mycobacterium sp. GA-1841]|uniref:hypothetical protein n=1 Tax=Mycobacterium sp. GA-1841 TaxID=1834154 RepID=UPI00096F46DC|nr:hypothetical protein [Mycobacterium sp. GA-1841]OMC41259.1 hypothetical protein A5740_22570 [Mycobacterium sp. GA-1841]
MTQRLSVDGQGLNAAAADSAEAAALLDASGPGTISGDQPSHVGVVAIRAAVASVRAAQSARLAQNGSAMSTASAVYILTDDGAAHDITRTV